MLGKNTGMYVCVGFCVLIWWVLITIIAGDHGMVNTRYPGMVYTKSYQVYIYLFLLTTFGPIAYGPP